MQNISFSVYPYIIIFKRRTKYYSFLALNDMASPMIYLGRTVFFILMIIQGVFFASYPVKYEHQIGWYGLLFLYLPALLVWSCILIKNGKIRCFFLVWGLYTWLALVPNIAVIFGLVEDKLEKDAYFGPNVFALTLCISPLLLLLLINTAIDSQDYSELITNLTFRMVLDLFDGIEILDIVLRESEYSHNVPSSLKKAMIAVAGNVFLQSPLQLAEIKFEGDGQYEIRKVLSALRTTIKICTVDSVLIWLRLDLLLKFGKESIFIAKNCIMIIHGCLELWSMFGLRKMTNSVNE